MSVNTMERVLYEIASTREGRKAFIADRDRFLGRFPLTDEERGLIANREVGRMRLRGVSPLLLFGFWMQTDDARSVAGYMQRIVG